MFKTGPRIFCAPNSRTAAQLEKDEGYRIRAAEGKQEVLLGRQFS